MSIFPGFVGPSYVTQSFNASVERCINLYPEKHEVQGTDIRLQYSGSPRWVYYGTPGLTVKLTASTSPIRAQYYNNGRVFAVAGAKFIETTGGVESVLGTVVDDGLPASLSSNGIAGNQILIIAGEKGYLFNTSTNIFSTIAAAGFPAGALQGGFLDGYFIVLSATQFNISKLNDGTTWAAGDKAQRSIAADPWVGMLVLPRFLWLWGDRTGEVWYDSGAAAFPFQPVGSVFLTHGIGAIWSACEVGGAAIWLATNAAGSRYVLMAQQLAPQRISTHAVETALASYATVSDFYGFSYEEQGHTFYVLTSPVNQATWVYDVGEGLWHERGWWNVTTGQYEAIRGVNHVAVGAEHWIGDRLTGQIYTQAIGTYTDAGATIRSLRRFPNLNNELSWIFYNSLQLDLQPGVGLVSGAGSAPQIILRFSDDGGYTWSNDQQASVGPMGAYSTRVNWRRLGRSRNRVFEIVQTDPVKRAWINCYLNEPGAPQ